MRRLESGVSLVALLFFYRVEEKMDSRREPILLGPKGVADTCV